MSQKRIWVAKKKVPKFKVGDLILDMQTKMQGFIEDITEYDGIWYHIHWVGSKLPDKIWDSEEIERTCRIL